MDSQETNNNANVWPEEEQSRQGCFSIVKDRIFYSYMNKILKRGYELHKTRKTLGNQESTSNKTAENEKLIEGNVVPLNVVEEEDGNNNKELSNEDLFTAPKTMDSDYLIKKFQTAFETLNEEAKQSRSHDSHDIDTDLNRHKRLRRIFIRTLWSISKPTYIPAGMFQLITVLVQTLTPILLQRLLILFEKNPNSSILGVQGITIAVSLFLCSIIDGLAQERQKFLAFQTGISIRAATVNAIYNQMLNLSAKGKENLLTGETTNLVAIDCQKLFEVCQEGHLIWSCPLSMIIVTILLLMTLGKATLVGMASMLLLVPVVKIVITKMMEIRRKRASFTDQRVEYTTAMLQAIRFCKLNHYEEKFMGRIHETRLKEIQWVRKELSMLGWTMSITVMTPVVASALTFITYALIDDDNVLTSADTFTTLLLFAALRFPINYVGKLIGKAAQGMEACQRIADFLDRDTINIENNKINENDVGADDILVKVDNGNFVVGSSFSANSSDSESSAEYAENQSVAKSSFTLSNINFTVKKSEVLCVVGPVAGGKSTLLGALIGDVSPALDSPKTNIQIIGSVSYASQSPFILNSTFRENILFGLEYRKDHYDRVINACNLLPDLNQLGPAGDLTEIGERGVTLSGGQKARISIARCVYAQPSVALFDDVLSALDAATAKWIFDHLFDTNATTDRLLSNSAVILVTHASHFLSRVSKLIILVKGSPVFSGHWDSLLEESFLSHNQDVKEVIRSIRSSVQELNGNHERRDEKPSSQKTLYNDTSDVEEESNTALMTVEEREYGLSDWRTWLTWYKYAGGIFFVTMTFITLSIDRGFYVINELWLATWTAAAYESVSKLGISFTSQFEGGLSAQYEFIKVYLIILVISFIATITRSQFIVQGGANCAKKLFDVCTKRVMYAPMSYFETTPIGRILNRLTYDVEQLDISLSTSMSILLISTGWFVTGVVLQVTILPYSVCVLVPVTIVYWLLLFYYRKSAVDLQRLDAVSRSPVQACLAESMDGCTTIRAFGQMNHFQQLFKSTVNSNTSAMMNFMAAQRWLGSRFQVLGSLVVLFGACFVVAFNDILRLETGLVAMLVIWSSNFTITLGFFSQSVSETEAYLTSVERLQDMTKLPQEKDHKTSDSLTLSPDWPSKGNISFENVYFRYRNGLPLALNNVTFNVENGNRIGICGRTGSGKSTIAVALFRLCEIESGKISLDGQNLADIGLSDVRGRNNGLCIIPQDPVLFSGTMRECLDPWGLASDQEIFEAIQSVQIGNINIRGMEVLDDYVDEGGRNYSVGERQLLCLARAVLVKPKVLILDEATASVDGETDAFIQQMIRKRFKGTTMLTIAHRLNTIMDFDKVLVMDKGKVAEFGPPVQLLENENGLFSNLVDSTGYESSLALREMANLAAEKQSPVTEEGMLQE